MYTLYLNGKPLFFKLKKADSYISRLKGWMFKQQITPNDALWIVPCNSIHTFFMRFAIDVIFFDRNGRVVQLCENLSPRSTRLTFNASAVIELQAGMIAHIKVKIGDHLLIKGTSHENV